MRLLSADYESLVRDSKSIESQLGQASNIFWSGMVLLAERMTNPQFVHSMRSGIEKLLGYLDSYVLIIFYRN